MSCGEELARCLSPVEDVSVLECAMSCVMLGDFSQSLQVLLSVIDSARSWRCISLDFCSHIGPLSQAHYETLYSIIPAGMITATFWAAYIPQLPPDQQGTGGARPLSHNDINYEWPEHRAGSPERSLELQAVDCLFTQVRMAN